MQGADFSSLYPGGQAPKWWDEFFYEMHQIGNRDRIPASVGVIGRDWRHWYWPDWKQDQLFDLRSDPGETKNLAEDLGFQTTQREMREKLATWIQLVK